MRRSKPTYVIGCIPLYDRDTPPPEQQNCVAMPCPECGSLMWLSEKKRIMMKQNLDFLLMCFPCCAEMKVRRGDADFETKQVDDILTKGKRRGKR